MRYVTKPTVVEAVKIIDVTPIESRGELDLACTRGINLRLENGQTYRASRSMIEAHIPEAGDYLIVDEADGGEVRIVGKNVFDQKYITLEGLNALAAS